MWGVSSTKDDMDFGWYMYGSSGQHHHSSPTTPTKRFHWNRWILFHYLLPVTWAILIDYRVELAGPFWLKHPLGSRFYLIVHPSIVQLHAKAYKEDSQRNLSTMNCLRVYYVDQHCDRFSRWVQAPAWSYGYALPVFWYQQWDRIATTRITTDGRWCSTHARLGHGIVGGGRPVRSHRPAWKYSSPGLQDWLKQRVPAKAAPLQGRAYSRPYCLDRQGITLDNTYGAVSDRYSLSACTRSRQCRQGPNPRRSFSLWWE